MVYRPANRARGTRQTADTVDVVNGDAYATAVREASRGIALLPVTAAHRDGASVRAVEIPEQPVAEWLRRIADGPFGA